MAQKQLAHDARRLKELSQTAENLRELEGQIRKLQGDYDGYRKQAGDDLEETMSVLSEKIKEIAKLDKSLEVKTKRMDG